MAATGYTPIQLYRTSTSGASPTAGNLNAGELAINYNTADMSVWALNSSGSVIRLMNNPAGLKYPTTDGTANYILKTDGAGNLSWTAPGGTGTVTSVAMTVPSFLSVSGSPITSSGTLAVTLSGTALPVANGGTGSTSTTYCSLTTNVTGTLPVANGGTGVTSSTGSGSVVLSTSPTLTTPALGTPSSGTLTNCTADGTNAVGYKNIPKSGSDKTTPYSLVTTDVGKYISVGSGGSITVPDATFSAGDAVSIFNNTSGNITLTMTITTAYISGTDADKATITLATRGVATILFLSGTICVVSGNVS